MIKKNRLANTKNPFQGEAKKVLCVCSAGLLRSPTTANVLHREFGYNTRAAGISEEYGLIIVDQALLYWADEIVTMDEDHFIHVQDMLDAFGLRKKDLFCLQVPDNFAYMDGELQEIILNRYNSLEEEDNG